MKKWLKENVPFPVKMAIKRQLAALGRLQNRRITGWNSEALLQSLQADLDLEQVKEFAKSLTVPAVTRQIKISIIIPVFNKAEFTLQCFRSLLPQLNLDETEIIIVNNASTDKTTELLTYFKEYLHIVNNESNLGFVEACNKGAAKAQGRFLIFLNNDTVILDGWQDALVETAEQSEDVGVVGSLLLYPTGKVQEAGGIVWKDGQTFHHGWGGSPEDHRFTFARDVDFCSGASLLIKKELFDSLGGFDTRFAPAYYEDVDLCFGARSAGYRVIFQPASRIVHFEGATAGRDVSSGFKQYQKVNESKFYDKWKSVLDKEHFVWEKSNIERAAHRKPERALIVFDDRVPTPDLDAGSARMFFILKLLSRHYRVLFVYKNNAPSDRYERSLWQVGVETAELIHYRKLLK